MSNSGLPDYDIDPEKTYTADDVNHIVARRIAQVHMQTLDQRVTSLEADVRKGFSDLVASMDNLKVTVQESTHDLFKCRTDLKDEIYDEFIHTKTFQKEMKIMDGKIDTVDTKVDEQWKRITVAVVVASVAIQIAFKFWG